MINRFNILILCSVAIAGVPCIASGGGFNEDIRPILMERCAACHGGVKMNGGVSVVYRDSILGQTRSGQPVVKPGDPGASELYRRITAENPDDRMPPPGHGGPLAPEDVAKFRNWIEAGAVWEELWSHVAPRRVEPPSIQNDDWPLRPMDQFILAKIEAAGVEPSPEADRRTWLRRVTLDLIGLPPSPEEIAAFEADAGSGAQERVVARLLDSPRFGERWTALWLDFARYADSAGYEKDMHRDVWAYRDWVIRAFNDDMPFDQFTIKQIAGDLLPERTLDDLVATVFHRNTKTNVEGGSDDEEFRTESVIDRVNTTWQVWQGTTFGCVQCHSHPYDPIRHEEYYKFLSFFNNTLDADLREEFPKLHVPLDRQQSTEVLRLENEIRAQGAAMMAPFRKLAAATEWQGFDSYAVRTSKDVKARVATVNDLPTIVTRGTLAKDAAYWTRLVGAAGPVAVLFIEAPLDDKHDAANPATGFVVSHLTAEIVPADGGNRPVKIAFIAADAIEGNEWPLDALDEKSTTGWGVFPKQFHDRWAVVVFAEPVVLAEGEALEVMFACDEGNDGGNQPVIQRYRIRYDTDPAWQATVSSEAVVGAAKARDKALAQLKSLETTTVPVLLERPREIARETRVFVRGNWTDKGPAVAPATPSLFGDLPEGAPKNRLGYAQWLVSDANPLTARVMVNHIWAQLFGRGIVATLGDFGSSGTPPTHPELLDYLALQFRDDFEWSIKRLVREIALSATYRQCATVEGTRAELDPENLLYTRGPRNRLSAEMIRDQALAVSGLLSEKMYGPPVMPPQPEGLWQIARGGGYKWVTSEGEDRYRRAVYTFWKRTNPYPSFAAFDAPERQFCTLDRVATNTPLQALVTLNDPVFFECAQALAGQMAAIAGGAEERVACGFTRVAGTAPSEREVAALSDLLEDVQKAFDSGEEDPKPLAETAEEAALIVVANTLLNLDKVMTK